MADEPIYLTQLIYVKDNQEATFQEFEKVAIPIIGRYNGQLLLRVRPDENAVIEKTIERPYEIHLVRFRTAADFQEFMQDEERKQFLHLKEQSIRASILIKGHRL